jgi:hypothetical protein
VTELAETARNANAGRGGRRAQAGGDVVIGEALDHAQLDGGALAVGQIGECLLEAVEPRLLRLHGCRRFVEPVTHPQTLAGP